MGNPKSFKIPINSPLATTLKASISHKLLEFLGNYTDDVLAEYITVLVCNGKHQNQARDDLEAFLGERSEEFVSWLWDLLLDYANQSNTSTNPLDPKVVTFSSPHDHDADMEYRANKSRNFQNHGTSNDDGSLAISTKGEELRHPSTYAFSTIPDDTGFSEGSQRSAGFATPSNGVNTEKVSPLMPGNDIRSKLEPVEDIYDDLLAHVCSGKDGFSVMPAMGEEAILYMDKNQKIVNSKDIDSPKKLLPSKQLYPRRLQSFIADNRLPRQTSAANAYGRSLSPKVVTSVSHQYDKSRGSVWDRLGKPHKHTFERSKTVDALGVSIREQNGEVLDQSVPVLPLPTERHSKQEVPRLGNGANNSGKCRILEGGVIATAEANGASNIRRKRHFGESSTGPGDSSVSLVGKGKVDLQYKETSGDSKKSKLVEEVSEAMTPAQKVLNLKLRFHQLEKEMHKLRSKHSDLTRGGKPDLSSSSGILKHPEEDIEPRTVYVTNVHFAATKEALSNHFAKCGLVVNVAILTDETSAQPKRSALITFACVESVDKALALSGTSFFSRTVKVIRKVDWANGKSAPPQVAGMPVQARFPHSKGKAALNGPLYSSPHLKWQRESSSTPSEPSASANIQ